MSSPSFINDATSVVEDMVQGILLAHPDLIRLGHHAILLRRDYAANVRDAGKVAILSGGGSGHEPAHAGFIGEGMLTGAICGGVFASPSVQAVLDAIRAVTGKGGCLLIVKNYTGDRLNFGIAAEQARSEGLAVRMVIVGDDVAVNCGDESDGSIAGRRGLAGTLFVHKVAGAAAASGESLEQVGEEASKMANSCCSYGVALTTCDVPGVASEPRIGVGEMEMGLGIHNEPGRDKLKLRPIEFIVDAMLQRIVKIVEAGTVALMVNNLGSSTAMEMYVATKVAMSIIQEKYSSISVARTYVGTFMTSLNMHGIMITMCAVGPAEMARLDAPTSACAWPKPPANGYPVSGKSEARSNTVSIVDAMTRGGNNEDKSSREIARCIAQVRLACEALLQNATMLNNLDKVVGDGDTGTTMQRGATEVLRTLDDEIVMKNCTSAAKLSAIVASSLRRNMGGSSGAILDIMLHTAAASLGKGRTYGEALADAVSKASFYGGAQPGFCTMLDALFPAAEAARTGDLAAVAAAAEQGAEATKTMHAKAGRSSYLPNEVTDGHPDPGAVAVAIALRAMCKL